AMVVSSDFENKNKAFIRKAFTNLIVVNFQPTCENLVAYFAERIRYDFPEGVKLHSLRLYETSKSYAEWFASDN
ncbi:MAG: 6-pyruvoyl trahydropterin synthase family protein, partial [Bacteroidales bacterium]